MNIGALSVDVFNVDAQASTASAGISIILNHTEPAEPALEISENSKNIEIEFDTQGAITASVLNTEDTVTSFDISAEGLTTLTSIPFDVVTNNMYTLTIGSDLFDTSENGTYEATLTANMAGGGTLIDTFKLTIAIVEP